MVHGIPTAKKKHSRIKRNSFEWLHKDMLSNKRAVEHYCNEVGTRSEKDIGVTKPKRKTSKKK